MNQEYEVTQFKKGDFQDLNQNYWCDMGLKGVSEPVKIVVKDPMQFHDGMTLYGHIEEKTSKAGKAYQRFYREQKPEQPSHTTSSPTSAAKPAWQPRDDNAIRAQWAIGQSVGTFKWGEGEPVNLDLVVDRARHFYQMVDFVKSSDHIANVQQAIPGATRVIPDGDPGPEYPGDRLHDREIEAQMPDGFLKV